jgi:PIN domain nuclease of toxin-antitoxin system
MAKSHNTTVEKVVRDSKSGRFITVRGAGALSGHLKIKKGVDLTKPIASQAMKGARRPRADAPDYKRWTLAGVLLDTHTLYWLVSGEVELAEEALVVIGESQESGTLYVSPVTAWELSIASQKTRVTGRPHLGTDPPARWFRDAVRATAARVIPIRQRISCEAASVVTDTGHKDPGDCFLIASARVRRVPIVTRDGIIHSIAAEKPGYLTVIGC